MSDIEEVDQESVESEESVELSDYEEKKYNETDYKKNLLNLNSNYKIIKAIPKHVSSNQITEFEIVECIGIRASQINKGSKVFTNYEGLSDPIDIAKKEFLDRKSPLILRRPVSDNGNIMYVDEFKVREMTFSITEDTLKFTNKEIEKYIK